MIYKYFCGTLYNRGGQMAITINMQILRKGTKYASYRIALPKDIIEGHNWEKHKFKLEVINNKLVLTPVKK